MLKQMSHIRLSIKLLTNEDTFYWTVEPVTIEKFTVTERWASLLLSCKGMYQRKVI